MAETSERGEEKETSEFSTNWRILSQKGLANWMICKFPSLEQTPFIELASEGDNAAIAKAVIIYLQKQRKIELSFLHSHFALLLYKHYPIFFPMRYSLIQY